ncbi:hypothetical protein [Ilumatobacter nonamiensis]|uniref:hypothetical protein n=1 Tax=Ilumatobacter nonamiensis TaxID=467093 RepID=UPI0011D260B7|nr:hypothetical protein [Ilumatobacter nonamiensis]
MSLPDRVPTVTDDDLAALEVDLQAAMAERSFGTLKVIGYGETGVAVAHPADDPVAVVKRLGSCVTREEIDEWFDFLRAYEELLAPFVSIAPTEKRIIEGGPDGRLVPFLIQPLFTRSQLVEKILEDTDPVVDHPMLVAVRDAALDAMVDGRQVIDSQLSNFAWDGERLALFDCGTPFVFHADGEPDYRLGVFKSAFPAVLRPVAIKAAEKVMRDFRTPNGNLAHSALSAVRLGQERWLDAIIETFNAGMAERGVGEPLERENVLEQLDGLQRDMKVIKVVGRLNRAYVEKVRRNTYDFFVTDSFTKELL